MVLRLGSRTFGPDQLLVMAVVPGGGDRAMSRVHEVVAEGADIVTVGGVLAGGADERAVPFVATIRDAYPDLVIGVSTGRPEVAREACAAGADLVDGSSPGLVEVAAGFGAGLAGPLALAERAVAAGVPVERIVVAAKGARELAGLVASGWPVLVAPGQGDLAGSLATAAVAAWIGARVFRVRWVRETRRALRMVSAIRGDIPPAYAVRGLA